jgi:hypothetical protein
MSFENPFGEDSLSIEKQRLIGLLERGEAGRIQDGLTKEDIQAAIISWTEEMEKRSLISSKEMVRFNVDRAAVCEAGGDIEGTFQYLDEALYQIRQEKLEAHNGDGWDELEKFIEDLIAELEAKYPIN